MAFPLWPTVFLFPLALCFYYFLLAGARTFEHSPADDLGAGLAQFSFLVTGTLGTLLFGYRATVPPANAAVSAAPMLCSLALYTWVRRTVKERRFHIAWSGEVPDAVCEHGPYRYVRHPAYASYMLAFAAMLAALPKWPVLAVFLFNVALFVHAARDDERSLAGSALAGEYARYKRCTGMFLPRIGARGTG